MDIIRQVMTGSENVESLLSLLYSLRTKHRLAQRNIPCALERRRVLSVAHHPFIVGIDYAFQTPTMAIMCLDFVMGGDLQVRCTSMMHYSVAKKGPRVLLTSDSSPSSTTQNNHGVQGQSFIEQIVLTQSTCRGQRTASLALLLSRKIGYFFLSPIMGRLRWLQLWKLRDDPVLRCLVNIVVPEASQLDHCFVIPTVPLVSHNHDHAGSDRSNPGRKTESCSRPVLHRRDHSSSSAPA